MLNLRVQSSETQQENGKRAFTILASGSTRNVAPTLGQPRPPNPANTRRSGNLGDLSVVLRYPEQHLGNACGCLTDQKRELVSFDRKFDDAHDLGVPEFGNPRGNRKRGRLSFGFWQHAERRSDARLVPPPNPANTRRSGNLGDLSVLFRYPEQNLERFLRHIPFGLRELFVLFEVFGFGFLVGVTGYRAPWAIDAVFRVEFPAK